jgi:hypothetical protein
MVQQLEVVLAGATRSSDIFFVTLHRDRTSLLAVEKRISFLAVGPQNAGTVYAASIAGVFKTTNGGATWSWVWVSGGGYAGGDRRLQLSEFRPLR